jgi:hypothetical protein
MNEREIANGFSAVWSEHFPMLSPTFIVAFNQAFVRPILGKDGIVSAVSSKAKTAHPDVLAEFGFRIAASALQAGMAVCPNPKDRPIRASIEARLAKPLDEPLQEILQPLQNHYISEKEGQPFRAGLLVRL